MNHRILWESVIGSHFWKMERPDSDKDLWITYAVPTSEMLSGVNNGGGSHFKADPVLGEDVASHEVSKVVTELRKGNINYIVSLMSPLELSTSKEHYLLRNIFMANPSRNIKHSCYGLAKSNHKKYAGKDDSPQRIAKVYRVLRFAIAYLREDISEYPWIKSEPYVSLDDIEGGDWSWVTTSMNTLKSLYEDSVLPDQPDPKPYREFLLNLRLKILKREGLM